MISSVKITDKYVEFCHGFESDENQETVGKLKKNGLPGKGLRDAWNRVGEVIPEILGHSYVRRKKEEGKMNGRQAVCYLELASFVDSMTEKVRSQWLTKSIAYKYDVDKGRSVIISGELFTEGGTIKVTMPEMFYDNAELPWAGLLEDVCEQIDKEAGKELTEIREQWHQVPLFDDSEFETVVSINKRVG